MKVLCLRILVEDEDVDSYTSELENSDVASMGVSSLGVSVEEPDDSDLAQLPG